MTFYVRQIKPYIHVTMTGDLIPIDEYDWVHEDLEEDLRKNIIIPEDWYSKLIFKERFVRVDTEV